MPDFLIFFIIQFIFVQIVISIFLHRGIAHKCFTFSPAFSYFCRCVMWLHGRWWPNWMQYYAALHRKHHVCSDTINDPHSPFNGPFLDIIDTTNRTRNYYLTDEEVNKYAADVKTPTDWLELNLFQKYPNLGRVIWSLIYFILFGPFAAIFYFVISLYFIPFEMIIGNWVFHKIGFRYVKNKKSDKSLNSSPWGIIWAGEELHANHHDQPWNPNFAHRWFEFDLGWQVAKLLIWVRLIKLRHKK